MLFGNHYKLRTCYVVVVSSEEGWYIDRVTRRKCDASNRCDFIKATEKTDCTFVESKIEAE